MHDMIPRSDANGYLPPGIHPAPVEEVEGRQGLPFLDLHIVGHAESRDFVELLCATDRDRAPKGMVELIW